MKNLIVLFLIIFISCTNESNLIKGVNNKPTISAFETNLKADMNYDAIVAAFGAPARDNGSGIHIYVYVLDDLTEVWIGYVHNILYARHMDKNHQLIKTLIENLP